MHGAVDDGSDGRTPCGPRRGRTRTSPTTTPDAPSTAGGPARRGSSGAGPTWPGPEGERRTTSAGRPAGLRLTTQWPVGPRRSDRRRPARGGCPLGSPPGAGAEPHRQGGGRSPTRRGRWDDDQGKAPRTLTPRGLLRARTRLPTELPTCPQGAVPRSGAWTTRSGDMSGSIHRSCPHLVHGTTIPRCAADPDLWTPCARPGGRRPTPPRPRHTPETPPHAVGTPPRPVAPRRRRDDTSGLCAEAVTEARTVISARTRRGQEVPPVGRGARAGRRARRQGAGVSTGCRSTETSGRAPDPSVKMTPRSGGTSP